MIKDKYFLKYSIYCKDRLLFKNFNMSSVQNSLDLELS